MDDVEEFLAATHTIWHICHHGRLADCGEQVGGAQQMRALRHDVSYRQNRHLGSNILAPRKEIIQTSR